MRDLKRSNARQLLPQFEGREWCQQLDTGSRSHKTGRQAAWLMAGGIPKRRSGFNGNSLFRIQIE